MLKYMSSSACAFATLSALTSAIESVVGSDTQYAARFANAATLMFGYTWKLTVLSLATSLVKVVLSLVGDNEDDNLVDFRRILRPTVVENAPPVTAAPPGCVATDVSLKSNAVDDGVDDGLGPVDRIPVADRVNDRVDDRVDVVDHVDDIDEDDGPACHVSGTVETRNGRQWRVYSVKE